MHLYCLTLIYLTGATHHTTYLLSIWAFTFFLCSFFCFANSVHYKTIHPFLFYCQLLVTLRPVLVVIDIFRTFVCCCTYIGQQLFFVFNCKCCHLKIFKKVLKIDILFQLYFCIFVDCTKQKILVIKKYTTNLESSQKWASKCGHHCGALAS